MTIGRKIPKNALEMIDDECWIMSLEEMGMWFRVFMNFHLLIVFVRILVYHYVKLTYHLKCVKFFLNLLGYGP